jgi:LacI family transcriptional regulator
MTTVAAKAGVSAMTVSRAFRNDPSIPEATRQRVRRLAAQMGYRPDPGVSQLMARLRQSRLAASEPIAWLTTHPTASGWRNNPASLEYHHGAESQAAELGYKLEEFWLAAPGMTDRRMSDILRSRGIRGVLVAPLFEAGRRIDLDWAQFAGATCGGFSLLEPALHRAITHHLSAIRQACAALRELGYGRIGLAINQDLDRRSSGMWLASLLREQLVDAEADRVPPLVAGDWSSANLMEWWRRYRPDVVISFFTALKWMKAEGLRVPQDCGFALLNLEAPGVAGIDEHRADVGAAAVNLVVEQLQAHRLGLPARPKIVMTECTWVDGATAPPRGSKSGKIEARMDVR